MRLLRRVVAALCLLALLTAQALAIESIDIDARNVLLLDPGTGQVFYEKAPYDRAFPASTTKLMTALLTIKYCTLSETEVCIESDRATLEPGSTTAGIKVDEELTIESLLYCLLLPSGNEAANILARHVGGSYESFVWMMNREAEILGCKDTHFVNPHGLHDEEHYTTAYDLSLIAKRVMEYETIRTIVRTAVKTIPETNLQKERTIYTTNQLIFRKADPWYYSACEGIKTGTTSAAGACLVSQASKGGDTLLAVVMGCDKNDKSSGTTPNFTETVRLLDWGFSSFDTKTLLTAGQNIATIPVELSTDTDRLSVKTSDSLTAVVPVDLDASDLTLDYELPESVRAPIFAGETLGHVTVSYRGEVYGTVDLVALNDVSMSTVLDYKDKLDNFFQSTLFRVIAFVLVVVLALAITLRVILVRRKEARRRAMLRRRYGGRNPRRRR